jgi:Ca2+/Na+ antiporter
VHEWDTFAVVVGGSAGALVGLLFVAISIHAARMAESADLRGRAAQTLVIFAALLLIALLLAIPGQSRRVLGAEFLLLAALVTAALIWLDRLARQTDSPRPVARTSIRRR